MTPLFDPVQYSTFNRRWLQQDAALHTHRLQKGDTAIPYSMQPNIFLLLDTITRLDPQSVLELGCGNGDNLHNLSVLLPYTSLRGVDFSPDQLDWAEKRNPNISPFLSLQDVTHPMPAFKAYDLTFTHTVLMHLDFDGMLAALRNLFTLSTHYVVLIENWETYAYLPIISKLFPNQFYYYFRFSPHFLRPQVLVVSKSPIKEPDFYPLVPDLDNYYRVFVYPQINSPDSHEGRAPGFEPRLPSMPDLSKEVYHAET